ncbi:MAG: GtrA family protein [Polyangiaceae bacterium]|nr:GtrA family protein [Polyangiaceae bacterium]
MVNPSFLPGLWIATRSAAVGAVATATDLVVLAALVSGLGVAPRVASLPALVLGIGVQFVGNKWFAFGDRSRDWLGQGVRFLGVEMVAFAANLLLFDLVMASTTLPYLLVRLMTTATVYFLICLPLWSRIFKPQENA